MRRSPSSAYIFKTVSDPYAGKISIFRVYSGSLNGDTSIYNASKRVKEKLGHLHRLVGKKEFPYSPASCGDIVAVNKLKDASTGDTLTDEAHQIDDPSCRASGGGALLRNRAQDPKRRRQAEPVPRQDR